MARFISKARTTIVPLIHESVAIVGNQVVKTKGKMARFENYYYETDDPQLIEILRNHGALKRGEYIEADMDLQAIKKMLPSNAQKTIRGVATSLASTQEKRGRPDEQTTAKAPKRFECLVCGKSFDTEKALKMHAMIHRKSVAEPEAPVAESGETEEPGA